MSEQNLTAAPAEATSDAFAVVQNVLSIIADQKACAARLRDLQDETATARKAKAELSTERAEFEQYRATELAAIAARADAVSKSEIDLFVRKNAVAAREDAAREVEDAWRHLAESENVRSGFQSAEFTPFEKAKRWIAGLSIVSTDGDADAKIDTSDTDSASRGNDHAFIETLPLGATLARAAQSPPRNASARRAQRRAAERAAP